MQPMIDIQDIGKKYHISIAAPYLSLRDELVRGARVFTGKEKRKDDFWALQHVSFRVNQGERIGIIGRNGAGKSTLLKILSRITPPTTGKIRMLGRVASLLEVGTGFHPELTGRENIYFNGAILGLRKKEIDQRLEAIIDFSGIESFIETPLKHYSSGMQLRLAFSVAAHLEPEILLIDEVLAVGDMEFQKKCMGKMEEVSRSEGRTILFVSHNMSYIASLCNKAILLDKGQLKSEGAVGTVINDYMSSIRALASENGLHSGNETVRLLSVQAADSEGSIRDSFRVDEPVVLKMRYEVLQEGPVLWLGYNLHNENGINVFDTHSVNTELYRKPHAKGIYESSTIIPPHLLNTGNFFVSSAIFNHLEHVIYLHEKDVLLFHIHDVLEPGTARGSSPNEFPGVVRPLLQWTINKLA